MLSWLRSAWVAMTDTQHPEEVPQRDEELQAVLDAMTVSGVEVPGLPGQGHVVIIVARGETEEKALEAVAGAVVGWEQIMEQAEDGHEESVLAQTADDSQFRALDAVANGL